jgi:hydroxyacylglutathione hydrolase
MEIQQISLKFLFDVNCYLIHTETGYFLIDTGIKNRRKELEDSIVEAGCQPDDLKLIIITHGHIDHIGNSAYLRNKYGAKIAMHRGDVKMVTGAGMFADAPPSLMIKLIGFLMKITGLSDFEIFTPDIMLEDNQSLQEYGLDATVLHTPGHSKGSISILTASGDLFCGDIFSGSVEGVTTLVDDKSKLDSSVEYLKALNNKSFYPGHGKIFHR